ncbi:hypothetical protein BH10BAC5_BH10BAC5_11360 [soil metagenome]
MIKIEKPHVYRTAEIIQNSIRKLDLDLDGLTILTEAGTNYYLYTPIIAAMAGAKLVNAAINDSSYGKAEDIKDAVQKISEMLGVADKINYVMNRLPLEEMQGSDIISNSGALRPINSKVLSNINRNGVIPVMYETWELREGEIDLDYCDKNKIKVAGTWENHPSIMVFDSVGMLAIKLSFEAGYEVIHNNIIVWSDDEFGKKSEIAFKKAGANSVKLTVDTEVLYNDAANLDFVYICNYNEKRDYWNSSDSVFDIEKLLSINNHIGFVHLYGNVDYKYSVKNDFKVYPHQDGKDSFMTRTLSHLGPLPLVRLQAAGFKVGYEMITEKYTDLSQKLFKWM